MTATNPVELRMLRKNLAAYIEADHVTIVLNRPSLVDSGVGGKRHGDPEALEPQKFRTYPMVRRMNTKVADKPEGDVPHNAIIIVGVWNADVQSADYFRLAGDGYVVESVDADQDDRKAAVCHWKGPVSADWAP